MAVAYVNPADDIARDSVQTQSNVISPVPVAPPSLVQQTQAAIAKKRPPRPSGAPAVTEAEYEATAGGTYMPPAQPPATSYGQQPPQTVTQPAQGLPLGARPTAGAAQPAQPVPVTETNTGTAGPAPVPAAPSVQAQIQSLYPQFAAGDDLRASYIGGEFTPEHLDRAGELIEGAGGQSPEQTAMREQTMQAILRAMQGTDRSALASQEYAALEEQAAKDRAIGVRDIGRASAKFGRIGSGMTTNDLGTLEQRTQEALERGRRDIALKTAEQSLADRMGLASLGLGATSQFAGMDMDRAGLDLSRAGALTGLEGTRYGLERGVREEDRGERDYQQGMADRAQATTERETQLNEWLKNSAFGREMDTIRTMMAADASSDPVAALMQAANAAQAAGDPNGAAMLLQEAARRRAAGGGGGSFPQPAATTGGAPDYA